MLCALEKLSKDVDTTIATVDYRDDCRRQKWKDMIENGPRDVDSIVQTDGCHCFRVPRSVVANNAAVQAFFFEQDKYVYEGERCE